MIPLPFVKFFRLTSSAGKSRRYDAKRPLETGGGESSRAATCARIHHGVLTCVNTTVKTSGETPRKRIPPGSRSLPHANPSGTFFEATDLEYGMPLDKIRPLQNERFSALGLSSNRSPPKLHSVFSGPSAILVTSPRAWVARRNLRKTEQRIILRSSVLCRAP
jgi:hypothetical protein